MHEVAYGAAGQPPGATHGYLETLLPLALAAAASLTVASLLPALLGAQVGDGRMVAPFGLAAGLLVVYGVQEASEALLLGGGTQALLTSLAVGWLVPPLALLLGLVLSASVLCLGHAELLIARRARPSRVSRLGQGPCSPTHPQPIIRPLACEGLAFGFARRPPPVAI